MCALIWTSDHKQTDNFEPTDKIDWICRKVSWSYEIERLVKIDAYRSVLWTSQYRDSFYFMIDGKSSEKYHWENALTKILQI